MTIGARTISAYVGQTRARQLIRTLQNEGIGEALQPTEGAPRRTPYFLDNGAFKAWRAGQSFNAPAFEAAVAAARVREQAPDFIVAPDVVGCGAESMALSLSWEPALRGPIPLAFVVQDGMAAEDVGAAMDGRFRVLFVGGSLDWKLSTAASWVRFAHARGYRAHIGRVGTRPRVLWARSIGADSIDSCTPLFSSENMRAFLGALREPLDMFGWFKQPEARSMAIVRRPAGTSPATLVAHGPRTDPRQLALLSAPPCGAAPC